MRKPPDLRSTRKFQSEVRRTVARAERLVRSSENKAMHQAAKFMPGDLKQLFIEGNHEAALAGLKESIEAGDPWALMAWLKAAGVIELPTQQVVFNMLGQLGVATEVEAAELVAEGKRLRSLREDGVALETVRDEAVEALKLVLREHPEWRDSVHAEVCSGSVAEILPVEPVSEA